MNPDMKSSVLLNAIKAGASADYQERVPDATQNNLAEVGTAIFNYDPNRNEYTQAIFDRIGLVEITDKIYTNPLSQFKKGKLPFGKTIEEVFIGLVESQDYNVDTAEQEEYKRFPPNVSAIFHQINRRGKYRTTVEEDTLSMAFTDEMGFGRMIAKIIEKLNTSNNFDEYILMKNLIHQYAVEGKFAVEVVPPVNDEASAKVAMTKIKTISNTLPFMKSDYNFAGVRTFTAKEDQIVLINPAFDAQVDVEVLASAFNMDKADFIGNRVLIDDFGGLENVLCAIVDRNWFMVYDKFLKTKQKESNDGLYFNYWLHVWQVISTSMFNNAVLFLTDTPVLSAIDVKPATATLTAGQALQLVVEATGTSYPPATVDWTHNGTVGVTFINSAGLLMVGSTETVTPITVTATSTYNALITDTAVITVV